MNSKINLKHLWVVLVLLIVGGAGLFFYFSKEKNPQDLTLLVPEEASFVFVLDFKSFLEKGDFNSFKELEGYKDFLNKVPLENRSYFEKPDETGLDFDNPIVGFFDVGDEKIGMNGAFLSSIKDEGRFKSYVSKFGKPVPQESYHKIELEPQVWMAWNHEIYALVFQDKKAIDPEACFKRIFKPEPDQKNITRNKEFKKLQDEKNDFLIWVSSTQAVQSLLARKEAAQIKLGLAVAQVAEDSLGNNTFALTYEFLNGKILSNSYYFLNEKFKKEFGVFFKPKLGTDFSSYVPPHDFSMMVTLGLNLVEIKSFLDKRALLDLNKLLFKDSGITIQEIVDTFTGDLLFVLYPSSNQNEPSLLAILSLKQKAFLDKLVSLLGDKVQRDGNKISFLPPGTQKPIYAVYDEKLLMISDKLEILNQIPQAGFPQKSFSDITTKLQSGWYGTYIDYKNYFSFLSNFSPSSSQETEAVNLLFKNIISILTVSYEGYSEGVIDLEPKDKNSLKVLLETANQAYLLYKNKADKK